MLLVKKNSVNVHEAFLRNIFMVPSAQGLSLLVRKLGNSNWSIPFFLNGDYMVLSTAA